MDEVFARSAEVWRFSVVGIGDVGVGIETATLFENPLKLRSAEGFTQQRDLSFEQRERFPKICGVRGRNLRPKLRIAGRDANVLSWPTS